jgi:hypothetical protein
MNCEDFENNVNDLAREQNTEATLRAFALAHGDDCETCSQRLQDERALSFKLRALALDTKAVRVPPMGNELLVALRRQQPVMSRPILTSPWRYRATVTAAMAVATVVLVVIAIAVVRLRSATPAAQSHPDPSGAPSVSPRKDEVVKAPDLFTRPLFPIKNATVERRKNGRRNGNRIVSPSQSIPSDVSKAGPATETARNVDPISEVEITTDFIPVGYASTANLQDGVQLVRVELPRSALVAFGLPMNVNRYNEKVKADVFFGSDGMARAIRFVQ